MKTQLGNVLALFSKKYSSIYLIDIVLYTHFYKICFIKDKVMANIVGFQYAPLGMHPNMSLYPFRFQH